MYVYCNIHSMLLSVVLKQYLRKFSRIFIHRKSLGESNVVDKMTTYADTIIIVKWTLCPLAVLTYGDLRPTTSGHEKADLTPTRSSHL